MTTLAKHTPESWLNRVCRNTALCTSISFRTIVLVLAVMATAQLISTTGTANMSVVTNTPARPYSPPRFIPWVPWAGDINPPVNGPCLVLLGSGLPQYTATPESLHWGRRSGNALKEIVGYLPWDPTMGQIDNVRIH